MIGVGIGSVTEKLEHAPRAQRETGDQDDDPGKRVEGGGEGVLADDDRIIPLADAERALISKALRFTGGNQSRAAKLLDSARSVRRSYSSQGAPLAATNFQ